MRSSLRFPKSLRAWTATKRKLKKGHAVPVLYAILAEIGVIPKKELQNFKMFGSMLSGHPEMDRTPGIEANTGSLGMGLSIGLGLGLAFSLDKKENKVYVILGDGELNEGQIWEAAMAISAYKLKNVRVIVDCNKIQASGPISSKFKRTEN